MHVLRVAGVIVFASLALPVALALFMKYSLWVIDRVFGD
jgi:hypothetical protein